MNKIIAGKSQILIQKEEMPAFRKNSIIYGKILEKSGDLAVIQIGDSKLKAMIDSSLPSSGTYWFEVKSSKEGNSVLLKMLSKADGRKEPSDAPQFILKLLKEANVARTKEHADFLQRVLREHPGITRKDLQQVLKHAAESGSDYPSKLMSSLSFALKNNLPLSDAVINSLCEVQSSETLYDQLKQLNSVIETEKLPLNALKAQIGSMIAQDFANDANNLAGVLSFFQKQLGLKGEISFLRQLAKGADLIHQEDSLKLLLLTASQNQTNRAVKEKIAQLISKLNGQVLLGADHGIAQHHFMQIPLHFGQFQSDLNIEWTGRKNERGEIDPDYCRVLFYLNMNVIKDIMIDLHIQNRVMTVTIYNQFKPFHSLFHKNSDALKEKLQQHHYLLSSIKIEPFKEAENLHSQFMNKVMIRKHGGVQGVDLKI